MGHQAIRYVMFAVPENAHISAAPDQLGVGHRLCNESRPQVGALKKSLNDLDSLLFEKAPQFESGPQRRKIVGALQGQQVNGARR